MEKEKLDFRFAIWFDNSEYPASLEKHKIYRVLEDEKAAAEEGLCVIDESDKDYLYPGEYFIMIDLPRNIDMALQESFMQ